MKSKFVLSLILCCMASASFATEYLTFYLGGQSNMDGYGYISDLPVELQGHQDAMIFHGNPVYDNQENGGIGIWTKLKPGHGTGFKTDAKQNAYSNRFGAELSFARTMAKHFPDKKIAIVKYSVGGTGLHLNTGYGNWSPDFRDGAGKNQYDYVLNTINNAFSVKDIDGDGENDILVPAGIIWMQGEADANKSVESANAYLSNLNRLMELIRAALRKDDVPVIIGKITDSGLGDKNKMPYIKIVQLAQQMFVEQDICAAYMEHTESYPYNEKDTWHYLSEGFVSMGEDFANVYATAIQKCQQ